MHGKGKGSFGHALWMKHSPNQACRLKFLDFFCYELLLFQSLLPDLLLDGPSMGTDHKVVLNYLPRNTRDVRWLTCKHIYIRPQEGNEHAFLFTIKGGTDGEGTTSFVLPCWHLPCRRWSSFRSLASRAFRRFFNGCAALRRGALPESLTRCITGFFLLFYLAGAVTLMVSAAIASL
jgi:hypothetical protein